MNCAPPPEKEAENLPPSNTGNSKRKQNPDSNTSGNKRIKINPGPESIIFIPFTPKSSLKKEIEIAEKTINAGNRNTRLKVIERNNNFFSYYK